MRHLTRDELERWSDEGPAAARERIVAHLAECDHCGALYGDVLDRRPASAGAAVADRPDLVVRGYRAGGGLAALRSRRVLAGLGVAAALLVALAVPVLRRALPPERDGIRGTSLQPLAPVGAVDPPVRFRWASPVKAARFAVEVRDGESRLLFVLTSDVEAVDLPPERLGELARGRTYRWEVVALDSSGDEMMRAPARTFVLPPARH